MRVRRRSARFVAGDFAIEERMLLAVRCRRVDGRTVGAAAELLALNEAVLEKTPTGHTVRLDVHIDGEHFTPYAADGLIVATPTGSTAYNLSARGPIVAPTHRALLLTPVSPHMLFDRTLVLDPTTGCGSRGRATGRPRWRSTAGSSATLEPGDAIVCTAPPHRARLVTFGPRDFHRILKAKFGLNER